MRKTKLPRKNQGQRSKPIIEWMESRLLLSGAPVTVAVTATPNPANPTDNVILTATLTATGTPTGSVEFFDGTAALGLAPVNSDVATLNVGDQLGGGTHSITALYDGDTNFASTTSPAYVEVVRIPTLTAITASSATALSGDNIAFTINVSRDGVSTFTPSGTVTIYADGLQLGTATLDSSGNALFNTGNIPTGAHQITASYGGDANFGASQSSGISETITSPTLQPTVSATTFPTAILAGKSGHGVVTVALTNRTSSTLAGSAMVSVFIGLQPTVKGATLLNAEQLPRISILPSQTILVRLPVDLPTPLANGTYTFLSQAVDPSGTVIDSAGGPTLTVSNPYVSLSPAIAGVTLPSSSISGASTKAVAKIALVNAGNEAARSATVALSLSPTAGVAGTAVVSIAKRFNLRSAGGSGTISVPLKMLPAVANGNYYLVATISDQNGGVTTATSALTYMLAAPFVKLSAAFAPLSAKAAQAGAVIVLTNVGNIDEASGLTALLGFSTDAAGADAVGQSATVSLGKPRVKAAGGIAKLKTNGWKTLISSLAAGNYYLTMTVRDAAGNAASAVSASQISVT